MVVEAGEAAAAAAVERCLRLDGNGLMDIPIIKHWKVRVPLLDDGRRGNTNKHDLDDSRFVIANISQSKNHKANPIDHYRRRQDSWLAGRPDEMELSIQSP